MGKVGRDIHRQMKILVVIPDDAGRAALLSILGNEGGLDAEFQIRVSPSADDALMHFREGHPDLILLSAEDLHVSGGAICRAVRAEEHTRHTGVIFIDQRPVGEASLAVECLETGADDFVRCGSSPEEVLARVRAVLRLKAMTDELRSANHRLRILSFTDELTGLANMRSFNQKFSEMLRHVRRDRQSLGVIMLDLDHFKQVNDTTNHLVGSHVIAESGRLMRTSGLFTARDVAARYGGDEFIIAAEADDASALKRQAEKLRQKIEAARFCRDGATIQITASIGAAWVAKGFHGRAEDIIKAADLMLYRSKDLGRNRVSCMHLKYPVNLEHVGRTHLVDEPNASEDDIPKLAR